MPTNHFFGKVKLKHKDMISKKYTISLKAPETLL